MSIKAPLKKYITANEAVAHAARLARVDVVAAYPITPQTTIVEKLASFIANGEMDADFIKVESEHSALTACMGVRMAGARAFTSTSSQGLEYMHEMLAYVSGGRYPLVLVNVCRSVALPWSIWGDQQDAIQQRDTGGLVNIVEADVGVAVNGQARLGKRCTSAEGGQGQRDSAGEDGFLHLFLLGTPSAEGRRNCCGTVVWRLLRFTPCVAK